MGAKSVIEVSAVSFPLPLRTPEEVKRSRSAGGPAVNAEMEDIFLAGWRRLERFGDEGRSLWI